jgi:serine/threonine protein kinase
VSTGPIDPSTIALPARYRVQRPVGVGGMATVHLAEDAESGAQVAIKLLKRDLAGSVMIERLSGSRTS